MISTVKSGLSSFPTEIGVHNSAKLDDPVGLKPGSENENAFAKALDLEINKKWPAGFNNSHFPACNVHGAFAYNWNDLNAQKFTPTAVGRSWAWLTNPANALSAPKQGPFKMIYTCFEPRRAVAPARTHCTRPNFHWFLFHGQEHSCIMIWVHHCIPQEQGEPQFGGAACK